ncbi:MAG: alanine racemase [Pseudomonadota bacterium]
MPKADALITIDLGKIVENYRQLLSIFRGKTLAAAVKADAYGLGASIVAPALARAGAESFFVASLEEGISLRMALTPTGRNFRIFILNGLGPGSEKDFIDHGLCPVLNSLAQIRSWAAQAERQGTSLPCTIHLDTGMARLGLPDDEIEELIKDATPLNRLDVRAIMSHLACADDPDHALNEAQLTHFKDLARQLPPAPLSIANSAGVLLGPHYHFDMARPGIALYGGNPLSGAASPNNPPRNPMAPVVRLRGKILQVREVKASKSVGYGATHRLTDRARLATVVLGYADGFMRSLSNRANAWIRGHQVPVVGRVSMDLVTLDISSLPENHAQPGLFVDFIGPDDGLDQLARQAGTIPYEILTRLGARLHRHYIAAKI